MLTTKYIFPLKAERPTFTIYSKLDLEQLPLDSSFNLIIRGKNLEIPLDEIQGDCIVRQTGCKFPLLKRVLGKLSVDAAYSDFPKLELVVGDCNLHENHISIPRLKEVWGRLRICSDEEHKGIRFAKSGNRSYLPKSAESISISKENDVLEIEDKTLLNLKVENFDGDIPVRIIYGNLTVQGCAPFFPFLECVFGDLNIIPEWSRSKKKKENQLELPIFFPKLQRVFGRLLVNKSRVVFPELQQVNNLSLLRKCTQIDLDALRWVEKSVEITCSSLHPIKLPALVQVKKMLSMELPNGLECSSLEYVGGSIMAHTPKAPVLNTIGGYLRLSEYSTALPSLQQIGGLLLGAKNYLDKIPEIKEINEIAYSTELHTFPEKSDIQVNHALFSLDRQIAIDESGFYINAFNINEIRRIPRHKRTRYPFTMLVALLKLRHGSLQNFKTRQLGREWPPFKGKYWKSLVQKIEMLWDSTAKYSIPAIFKLKNQNLKRFCFSFVGVEEIMNILKAERISTEGIEMDYFQYDDEGNEFKIQKHNIYEIYRASIDKIPDLNSWRARRRIRDGYVYAVKCWCTSTTKAHWLWVEPEYTSDPLTAIASTFRIHGNVIPHIKCLKRQGDLLICEMEKEVIPKGRIRPLTKEEYFSLLKAES